MVKFNPNEPNPIGALNEPEKDPNAPKRNRNVASPGSRGGHYRRIWSNRLHKFYVKYGKGDSDIDVDNSPQIPSRRKPQEKDAPQESLSVSLPSRLPESALEELLNGLFQTLLGAFKEEEENTGLHHSGRRVSFGDVTKVTGEIVTHEHHRRSCYLYNEKGKQIQYMFRRIRDPLKVKSFFCYMTAKYAMKEFVDGEKKQMGKGLLFSQSQGSSILRNVLDQKYEQSPEFPEFSGLKNSLSLLRLAHEPRPSSLFQKSVVHSHLKKAFRWLDRIDSDRMEKSGPKQIMESMMSGRGKRYGSVGSGSTSIFRTPGRPRGTSQNLTAASATMPSMSFSPAPTDPRIEVSEKDWRGHKHLKIGARVRVQHPFEHEKPVWGKVSSMGEHGIQVTDDEGNVTNIRWPHIFDVQPRIDNTPQNAFELARMRIPMEGVSGILPHQSDSVEKELRKLAMPFDKDVIHSGHDDKLKAYSYLFSENVPIDDIAATQTPVTQKDAGMEKLTQGLINHALSMRIPVDTSILKELPFERVVAVIHHHLNGNKEN